MATRRPLAIDRTTGVVGEIPTGDTIDPVVLPPSGATPPLAIAAAVTYSVAANTQVLIATEITVDAGGELVISGDGELVKVT